MNVPAIQVEALSVEISGHGILDRVSLSAHPGEYISIIGPNGAGKTTLIKCLAGIYPHWTGSIRIAGRNYSGYSPKERARILSYVPQAEGRPVPLTVEEFVAMGRYPHLSAFTTLSAGDHEAVACALQQAGLTELRHRAMNTLSGGERQMAFIASALAQESGILLLDEPATFLDYRHQANVAALLKASCRENGITIVAVHHDINTAGACADTIYALRKGSVAFAGPPADVLDVDILQSLYDTPFSLTPSPHTPLPLVIPGGAP